MSKDIYESYPNLKNDQFMKKIDESMDSADLNAALNAIDTALADLPNANSDLDKIKKAHAYVHKGTIYHRQGKYDKAKQMWEDSKGIHSDGDADWNLGHMKGGSSVTPK